MAPLSLPNSYQPEAERAADITPQTIRSQLPPPSLIHAGREWSFVSARGNGGGVLEMCWRECGNGTSSLTYCLDEESEIQKRHYRAEIQWLDDALSEGYRETVRGRFGDREGCCALSF